MQAAINDYNKAIEMQPTYMEPYINRGRAYSKIGQLKKAVADYQKFLRSFPRHPQAQRIRNAIAKLNERLKKS